MDYLFIVIVGLLFIFAVSDLIVGVSNDAVNFLNSGIGAKAGSFKMLMFVSSIGVLVGALFSSGMMEVAKSGIFHPAEFNFNEILYLFLAVIITDVLLLDVFNTYGLPTSTTVSLVFGLLGSAFSFSIVKIVQNGETISQLSKYINTDKALAIIGAIFISIAIAFIIGYLIMLLSRLIFTFHFENKMKVFGSVFGGISISFISYFIFIKGMKDVSFIPEEAMLWVNSNLMLVLLYLTIGLSALFFIIQLFVRLNVFRVIVFFGTFALAMAFAGNDLVNFIGVPLAGFKSFQIFSASGSTSPETFSMEMLAKPVHTEYGFLIAAGFVMIFALWFSKKTRTVISTSVNLSKQKEGEEQFGANHLSRTIVRFFFRIGSFFKSGIFSGVSKFMDSRFTERQQDTKDPNPPAFDMVRAALNLMVSSSLIAFGTSLKLPLSTTYVTFMVAMGTSLADRAWGRESAVYRVSGVFTVIGGWFITAFAAFTLASIIGFLFWWGQIIALIIIIPLVFFILFRTFVVHKKNEATKKSKQLMLDSVFSGKENLETIATQALNEVISQVANILEEIFTGLKKEDAKKIKKTIKLIKELDEKTLRQNSILGEGINTLDEDHLYWGEHFIKVNESLRGIVVSLSFIAKPSYQHLNNMHKTLGKNQQTDLELLINEIKTLIKIIEDQSKNPSEDSLNNEYKNIINSIDDVRAKQIQRIKKKENPSRSNLLFLNIISEIKVIAQLLMEIHKTESKRNNFSPDKF